MLTTALPKQTSLHSSKKETIDITMMSMTWNLDNHEMHRHDIYSVHHGHKVRYPNSVAVAAAPRIIKLFIHLFGELRQTKLVLFHAAFRPVCDVRQLPFFWARFC
jgi:hypothetical protein